MTYASTDFNNDGVLDHIDANIYLCYVQAKSAKGEEPSVSDVQAVYDAFVAVGAYEATTIITLPSDAFTNISELDLLTYENGAYIEV